MNNSTKKLTIGLDLGDRHHKAVCIDEDEEIVFKEEMENTPDAVRAFFSAHPGALVGMETGAHCRWVSALAQECGCRALVGNARKLRIIFESSRKNDWRDAEMIANLCRSSKKLFHPVELHSDERHKLLQMLKIRDGLVAARTAMINMVRGMNKANAGFVPKSSPESFARRARCVDGMDGDIFHPVVDEIDALTEKIRHYDMLVAQYIDAHFREDAELLETIPGVGTLTGATFLASIPSVDVFKSARDAGAYFGLIPRQDQSGASDTPRRITKEGNALMRRNLVTAANYIMRESSPDSAIKRFGLRVRGGDDAGKVAKRKAKIAVARKLAVTMAAMLKNRERYRNGIETGPAAGGAA